MSTVQFSIFGPKNIYYYKYLEEKIFTRHMGWVWWTRSLCTCHLSRRVLQGKSDPTYWPRCKLGFWAC